MLRTYNVTMLQDPDDDFMHPAVLSVSRRADAGHLALTVSQFDSRLSMFSLINVWCDSVTRRPYALSPELLDYEF